MSVAGILAAVAEIKMAYQKIVRPFIAWRAKRARAREEKRHGNGPTLPPIALALALACLMATGCARWDHGMIWLDDALPQQSGEDLTTKHAEDAKRERSPGTGIRGSGNSEGEL